MTKRKPGEELKQRGRPTVFKPEYCEPARKLALLGATDRDAADFFGVYEATLNRWKLTFPEFCECLKVGKDEADARVEQSLYRRATGYSFDSDKIVLPAGKPEPVRVLIVQHVPPDTTAMIFWLKNRKLELWRDKAQVEHTGKVVNVTIVRQGEEKAGET